MSESSSLVALNADRFRFFRCVAGVLVATTFIVLFPSRTTKADGQLYSVVAHVDAKKARLASSEVVVRIGNITVPATAISAAPAISLNIAIVLDAGADQAKVLSKEKELAISLIHQLADARAGFTIVRAGSSPETLATTPDPSAAIEHIQGIIGDTGEKTSAPVYDAIGAAIRQVSLAPGLHVIVFIGEGNDGGSSLRYPELRRLAESNQIAFFAALISDHSLRGTKSILRYGWNLQELTSESAGIFLENQKTLAAARRLSENVRSLRLVTFEMPSQQPGRYRISVSARGKKLHAQKAIVVP